MFLAGYPNDGCAIVDPVTQKASVYDTIPEAKQYYRKLNEMYACGVIDPETFTLSFQQYLDKISTGTVLGMVDQYWQFMTAQNSLYANGKEECTYVPFPITADEGIRGNYNCREENLNVADGIGISIDCEDVEGALQFLNDLLSPEIMVLRNWGEEGIDYEIDEDGCFYRTDAQRASWADGDYLQENVCPYAFFPAYEGMLAEQYERFIDETRCNIGYLYRYIFNTTKFVLDDKHNKENKEDLERYLNLLQAQLSNEELCFIFYNAISKYGKDKHGILKFKEMLDNTQFLENIDSTFLLNRNHYRFYPHTSFKFLKGCSIN